MKIHDFIKDTKAMAKQELEAVERRKKKAERYERVERAERVEKVDEPVAEPFDNPANVGFEVAGKEVRKKKDKKTL
jgi:uncharacterized protein YcgL (UPF0745 family)